MPSRAGRPTLATVAASAGVSVATVSKVVNGRSDVAPATRALVQSLLQEHNYVGTPADSAARGASPQATVELAFAGDSQRLLHRDPAWHPGRGRELPASPSPSAFIRGQAPFHGTRPRRAGPTTWPRPVGSR